MNGIVSGFRVVAPRGQVMGMHVKVGQIVLIDTGEGCTPRRVTYVSNPYGDRYSQRLCVTVGFPGIDGNDTYCSILATGLYSTKED